jgi:hypothetical protein
MNYDFSGLNIAKEYSTPIAPGIIKDPRGYFVSYKNHRFLIVDEAVNVPDDSEGECYEVFYVVDSNYSAYIDRAYSFIEAVSICYAMQ